MSVTIRITNSMPPPEIWKHGYRTGREHALKGWPSLIDDDWETGQPLIPPDEMIAAREKLAS